MSLENTATLKESVRRMMKLLMKDELAKQFNFIGLGNKYAFSSLAAIIKAICGNYYSILYLGQSTTC